MTRVVQDKDGMAKAGVRIEKKDDFSLLGYSWMYCTI